MSGAYGWQIRSRSGFWGGPKLSQWKSVPFYILGSVFAYFGSTALYFVLDNTYTGLQPLNARGSVVQGEIVRAEPVGLGFWRIGYVFQFGRKTYFANRVAPGSYGHSLLGEWIWPSEHYDKLTKVGSEVTVYINDIGNIAGASCIDPAATPYYLSASVGELMLYLYSAYLMLHKVQLMNRYYTLHNTQTGMNLLKGQQLHQSLGRPGKGPAERYLENEPLDRLQWVSGRKRWEELSRQDYDEMSLRLARERRGVQTVRALREAAIERERDGDLEAHSVNRYVEGSEEDIAKQRAAVRAQLPRSAQQPPKDPPASSA